MPSPFPGMDPYLEASGRWQGFHNTFIANLSQSLNDILPPRYAATVDLRIELLEAPGPALAAMRLPDVAVTRGRPGPPLASGAAPQEQGGVALVIEPFIQPQILTLPRVREVREAYIYVLTLPSRDLVTSIELLSPTNKTGDGRGSYLAKRRALVMQSVNLVEIDLLLGGERLEMVEPLPAHDGYVFVSRGGDAMRCAVYGWGLRRSLPVIPVPLKSPDADVPIDLGQLFNMTYDRGRYRRLIDYDAAPPPIVPEHERDWAQERVRAAV